MNLKIMYQIVFLLVAAAMASECGAVTVTAFAARHGEKTSTGTTPVPGRTAAVSRDMRHLIGKRIHIKGVGWRVVESVTHRKLRRTIDVLVASSAKAKKFGRKDCAIVAVR